MAIASSDLVYRLSGGSSNTDPNAALGGAQSSTASGSSIFDSVSSAEASAGDVEYRCVYVRNSHASLTAVGVVIWIQTQTPQSSTSVDIALGTSAVNGTEQTIANENTAPTGTSFTAPSSYAGGLTIGDLAPSAAKAVWIRRTVNSSTVGPLVDSFKLRIQCDTLP